MPENYTCTLTEERGDELQSDAVHLPGGKASLCAVIAFRDGEIYDASRKRAVSEGHGVAPFVAASVFGVTKRVSDGAYVATSALAAS